MDRSSDRPKETQTLLQVPNFGAREGVSFQRLRLQAEAVGVGKEPQPDGASGKNMVPEPADEEQEKLPEAGGPTAEQQQLQHQQSEPSRQSSPSQSPCTFSTPVGQPSRFGQWQSKTSSVTNSFLRGRPGSSRLSGLSTIEIRERLIFVLGVSRCRTFAIPDDCISLPCQRILKCF